MNTISVIDRSVSRCSGDGIVNRTKRVWNQYDMPRVSGLTERWACCNLNAFGDIHVDACMSQGLA